MGGAIALFAGAASAACITAIPDLVVPPLTPPTIDHGAVQPPEGPLSTWPDHFTIPVRVTTPGETVEYEFVYDRANPSSMTETYGHMANQIAPDGGTTLVVESPPPPMLNPSACPHTIEFVVGHTLTKTNVPDSLGGDFVRWQFLNGGVGACPVYDAGTGQLPLLDASTDAVIVIGGDT